MMHLLLYPLRGVTSNGAGEEAETGIVAILVIHANNTFKTKVLLSI